MKNVLKITMIVLATLSSQMAGAAELRNLRPGMEFVIHEDLKFPMGKSVMYFINGVASYERDDIYPDSRAISEQRRVTNYCELNLDFLLKNKNETKNLLIPKGTRLKIFSITAENERFDTSKVSATRELTVYLSMHNIMSPVICRSMSYMSRDAFELLLGKSGERNISKYELSEPKVLTDADIKSITGGVLKLDDRSFEDQYERIDSESPRNESAK